MSKSFLVLFFFTSFTFGIYHSHSFEQLVHTDYETKQTEHKSPQWGCSVLLVYPIMTNQHTKSSRQEGLQTNSNVPS